MIHQTHDVGQLVPLWIAPDVNRLRALQALSDKASDIVLPDIFDDRRFDKSHTHKFFQREMYLLVNWMARRLIALSSVNASTLSSKYDFINWSSDKPILALLPRHGLLMHLIRRVIPFMLLNRHVDVSFPEDVADIGAECCERLVNLLELRGMLSVNARSSYEKVENASAYQFIHITGSGKAYHEIVNKVNVPVIGATGRCSLLVGKDWDSNRLIYDHLCIYNFPRSCTRLMVMCVLRSYASVELVSGKVMAFEKLLKLLHPTFLYSTVTLSPTQSGYRVLFCRDNGVIDDFLGFAQDPVAYWPGDFRI